MGLRERKKAKTRALIQAEALRLFSERGYAETSVEEIAEAAEVSPRTVFRYFPTKADLVLYDTLDEILLPAIHAQPRSVGAIDAIRASLVEAVAGLHGEALEVQVQRERLMRTVPELHAATVEELARSVSQIGAIVAERSGRAHDDPEVLALSGAVMGVVVAAWLASGDTWTEGFVGRVDDGLARLKAGFRL